MPPSSTLTIPTHRERRGFDLSGWSVLLVLLIILAIAANFLLPLIRFEITQERSTSTFALPLIILLAIFVFKGFFVQQPNEARLFIFFGSYVGTTRKTGLRWTVPLFRSIKLSLRARSLMIDQLKVNDKNGNPIEIAGVFVWRLVDTAQAIFDVDQFESYIRIQSESAIRHLASEFPYDHDDAGLSLRGGGDQLLQVLRDELQARVERAGVHVDEARLTHLAYAPEIAQAMLRKQQAEAVIAARQKIVQGAVSIVDTALHDLRQIVELDPERKAVMVSNLLVVLCGESQVQPVINTGSLNN